MPKNSQFTEGVDFYIENGLYVFTEKYLLKRGYCCKNGCRHCPYGLAPLTPEGGTVLKSAKVQDWEHFDAGIENC